MATSSNAANQAASAAVETGGTQGGIIGGGSANVSFDGQAPAQQVSNEKQASQGGNTVENIVTQSLNESPIVNQQPQREIAASQPTAPQQTVQRASSQMALSPQSANTRTETIGGMVAQAASMQQPTMQQVAPQQPTMQTGGNLVGPRAQQPQGGVGTTPSTVGPTMSTNNLAENQPVRGQQQAVSQSRFPNAPTAPTPIQRPEQSNQKFEDRKQMFDDMSGRSEIRREGVIEKPEPVNMVSRANRRFKKSREFIQKKIKKTILHGRSYSGTSFYETIFSMPSLMPHCVSIGSENLLDSLREPNSTLLALVNEKRAKVGLDALDAQFCIDNISVLVDAINDLNIEVTLEKTPVNVRNSIQVRTLRAHYGRGLGLHPTQTKAYNADYDGDPAVINLDQNNIRGYNRAMTQLVDIEGNATIDPDFFPLDPINPSQRHDIRNAMRESYFEWNPDLVGRVYDAYEKACNDGDWVGLMRRIDEVTGIIEGEYRGEMASAILKSLYDFSTDRRGLSLRTQFEEMVEHSNYNPPDMNLDPFVYHLVDLIDEIVAGRPAPNFQEFTRFYNKYYGDVHGKKNVPFRLLADFAKAINRTDLITVGSDVYGIKPMRTDASGIAQDAHFTDADEGVSINDLWQFTCAAGTSKQIAGRMHMGSRQLAVSTQVRTMVSKECPIPYYVMDDSANPVDQQFRIWIKAFIDSYNRNMRMLSISQISFRQGMIPVRGEVKFKGIDERTLEGLDKALVEVFGDKTVERMFPGTILSYGRQGGKKEQTAVGIVYSYRNMSLENFSTNNRISFKSEGQNREIPKKDAIKSRIARDEFTPMDVLLLVADRRTKQLGDYNKAWLEATKENQLTLSNIQDALARNDYNDYVSNMLEFMHLMSPTMFDYFGMDSLTTFANSKWGKKLIGAKNLSEFRSHLLSMTIEYRLNKSSKILAEIDEISKNPDTVDMEEINRLETLDAAFELEIESLASSSMVWDTIAKEMMEGNRTFLALVRDKGIEGWSSRAASFWKSEQAQKYHTLVTFLKSSEPYETKIAVLADVTRVRQQYADVTIDEIMGQLAHHPNRLYAGPRFDMDSGIRFDIDTMKESINRINSYRDKSQENIEKESARVIKKAKENKPAFEAMLRRFSDDPGYMVHVDTILAADAIASIYDKTYDDSEKIKQQAVVNGYFGAVSLQRSGGYYTHLQQTDNAVVNMIGFDQLNVIDIVRILGNPDISVRVYDEFGMPAIISRETLCGGTSIDDVVRYLEVNPRISLACRRFMAGVNSDVNGTARMSAMNSEDAGDTPTTRVFSLLNDRPRFLAIAALCTPANNNVGRNLAEDIHDNLNNLCNFIARESIENKTPMEIMRDAQRVLGIRVDTIEKLMASGSFDADSDLSEYFTAGGNLYAEVMREILDAIGVVQQANVKLPLSDVPAVYNMSLDESSVVSYYDARQQLSGARTATMIGIEGAETKKNLVLKEYLKNRPDRFMTFDRSTPRSEILAFEEFTKRAVQEEIDASEDGSIVVEVPENWNLFRSSFDETLEHNPRKQIGSICKFLEIKREKGAETFNAKSKKFGDDGTNSIIKFIKMGTRSMFERFGKKQDETWSIEDGQELLDRIAKCESKDEAVAILAQALIDADARLGYTDGVQFVKSDYWNRADLMLAENEDGSLAVRTLEQLAAACRNRLSDEAIISENEAIIVGELQQIVDTVGTTADPMTTTEAEVAHRCLNNVSLHSSIGNRFRIDRALRQRSSSTERNYALMYKIFQIADKEKGGKYIPPSRDRIEAHSRHMLGRLDSSTQQAIKSLANPDYVNGSYDYMGSISDSETIVVPGPQSLILFDLPKSDPQSQNSIDRCRDYGMTAAFRNINDVPTEYLDDVIFTGDLWILPFFDMMLNGSMSEPIMPAPAQFPFNPDNVITNVEDTTYEFKEGDATYHMTRELADRVRVNFRGDDQVFDVYRLFPNVLRAYPDSDFQMDFCTNEEIQRYIINADFDAKDMVVNGFDKATVDIGVIPGNENFDREAERFRIRLQEYQTAFGSSDADGMLTSDVRYDSIVGFVKIIIDGNMVALAPIWPFHLEESGSVPTTFQVDKIEFDPDSHSFNLSWRYSGGLEGQYIKAFEGIGASNKMIASSDYARSRSLENGLAVDGFYSTKSVASRLFASNKRIHTMISLMMIPRVDKNYSYNFAELSGSFPDDPKLPDGRSVKDALLAGDMNITDWIVVRDSIKQFHVDPEIDSLVRFWVDKCIEFGTVNPTILLATKTNNGVMWPMATEFECFMDTSPNFQNALMKFMHMMQPTLCPESVDGDSSATLFKPVTNNTSEDYGVLQMLVPHYGPDGKEYMVPENVYLSFGFFGDEFSGFKKVNFNAFNRSIDSLNVSNNMNGFDLSQMMSFGRSGMSSVTMSANMMQAVPDEIMHTVKEQSEPITSFRGKYDFLSNMYESQTPFVFNNTEFTSAEAAFQGAKLAYRKHGGYGSDEMEEFASLSGYEAKKLGKQIDLDTRAWDRDRNNVMRNILIAKFSQDPDLEARLLATGDVELIEGNTWGDTYWGVSNGSGQNNLGKILMEVRSELAEAGE
jgi:hypothetical protein